VAQQALVSSAATAYTHTAFPELTVPWRAAEFCVIDVETTGLDAATDEMISFAALQITHGRLRLSDARYEHIRPQRMPDARTIRIHGLRESDLVDAPPLSEVLDGLLEAVTGKAIVAHVAAVERAFLTAALSQYGLRLSNPIVDTAALAAELFRRRRHTPLDSFELSPLARALGLPAHRPHHADGDALTTAQVFLALATHLDLLAPQTVGSLSRYGTSPRGLPMLRSVLARGVGRFSRS
jgi:DNA polymerase III subunit epsilon